VPDGPTVEFPYESQDKSQDASSQVLAIAWSPDSRLVVTAGTDNVIRVGDVSDPQRPKVRSFPGHTGHVAYLAFNGNGQLLASASQDRSVRIWDLAKGQTVRTLTFADDLGGLAFMRNGDLLVGSKDNRVYRTILDSARLRAEARERVRRATPP
jgi:WD40 repeat protein